jgi:hypothetical protein
MSSNVVFYIVPITTLLSREFEESLLIFTLSMYCTVLYFPTMGQVSISFVPLFVQDLFYWSSSVPRSKVRWCSSSFSWFETWKQLLTPSLATQETVQQLGFRYPTKVTVSIPAFDLFPHPRITPFCIFSLTYSCTCLELFPRAQSMQVHDLAKNE